MTLEASLELEVYQSMSDISIGPTGLELLLSQWLPPFSGYRTPYVYPYPNPGEGSIVSVGGSRTHTFHELQDQVSSRSPDQTLDQARAPGARGVRIYVRKLILSGTILGVDSVWRVWPLARGFTKQLEASPGGSRSWKRLL